jgi:hypothetical protein
VAANRRHSTEETMQQIRTEYLSLRQAARLIPPTKDDSPTHPSTLARWITKGAKTLDGTYVKLKARRYPSGWRIHPADLDEFIGRLTAVALKEDPSDPPRVVGRGRLRELARVDRELEARGLGIDPSSDEEAG